MTVEDDGVGLGGGTEAGTGKGLGNARERLRLTYGEAARLDVASRAEGGTRVVVTLPAGAREREVATRPTPCWMLARRAC